MKPDALTIRSAAFAALFGPSMTLSRKQAVEVSNAVCDALSLDEITFVYKAVPLADGTPGGFSLQLQHSEEREVLRIAFENRDPSRPMTLCVTHAWPAAMTGLPEQFDRIVEAVTEALPESPHRVLVETRLRAHAPAADENGAGFLDARLSRGIPEWIGSKAPAGKACSVKYRWDSTPEQKAGKKGDAKQEPPVRELQIEPLSGTPGHLYFEQVSRWTVVGELTDSDRTPALPSSFLEDSLQFLSGAQPTKWTTSKKPSLSKKALTQKQSAVVTTKA